MSDIKTREEVLREESRESDKTMVVDPAPDRVHRFQRLGLSRMKREWDADEAIEMTGIYRLVEDQMLKLFGDAYLILNDIYDVVREPVVDEETGVIETDRFNFPVWKRTVSGAYVEDYRKLTSRDMNDFLFKITTRLFEWKQKQADLWGEAMFAKALWEEQFSLSYDEANTKGRNTVEDRTQRAKLGSREERYFGIFQALISRKADNLVSSLELLSQRLKDVSIS